MKASLVPIRMALQDLRIVKSLSDDLGIGFKETFQILDPRLSVSTQNELSAVCKLIRAEVGNTTTEYDYQMIWLGQDHASFL